MTQLTREETIQRLDGVLKAAGVTLELGSCGCCDGVVARATFPDGSVGEHEHFSEDLGGELPRR